MRTFSSLLFFQTVDWTRFPLLRLMLTKMMLMASKLASLRELSSSLLVSFRKNS